MNKIDINIPVKQGEDMVINYDDGDTIIGHADLFYSEAAKGRLMSLPPDDNPKTQTLIRGNPDDVAW